MDCLQSVFLSGDYPYHSFTPCPGRDYIMFGVAWEGEKLSLSSRLSWLLGGCAGPKSCNDALLKESFLLMSSSSLTRLSLYSQSIILWFCRRKL